MTFPPKLPQLGSTSSSLNSQDTDEYMAALRHEGELSLMYLADVLVLSASDCSDAITETSFARETDSISQLKRATHGVVSASHGARHCKHMTVNKW